MLSRCSPAHWRGLAGNCRGGWGETAWRGDRGPMPCLQGLLMQRQCGKRTGDELWCARRRWKQRPLLLIQQHSCFVFPTAFLKVEIKHGGYTLRFIFSCSLHLNIITLSKQRFIHLKKFRQEKGKSINYCTALNIYRILILTKSSRSRRTIIMTKCIEIVDRTTQ